MKVIQPSGLQFGDKYWIDSRIPLVILWPTNDDIILKHFDALMSKSAISRRSLNLANNKGFEVFFD
jgi:hypothetical protein